MYHKSRHESRDVVVIDEEDSVEAVKPSQYYPELEKTYKLVVCPYSLGSKC